MPTQPVEAEMLRGLALRVRAGYRRVMMFLGVHPCRLVSLTLIRPAEGPLEWEAVLVDRWWATEEDVACCKAAVSYGVLKTVREFTGNRDLKLGRMWHK